MRVEIGDGQLRVAAFDWGSGEDYLTLGGSVTMGDDAQVDLSVTGEVDVRLFSALVPAGATAGHALLIANVQGPLDDPSLVGTIELTDAAVRMTDPRLTVSNLNGAILLSRNAVVIHEMTGEANGGRVAVEGTLTLNGFRPLGTVRLTGERMAMDVPEGLRTEVDADLVLALGADDVVLSGTATVRRGAYREPMTLAGGVLGFLEQRQTLHVVQLDEPGALDDVQLDLQVTTAEDIRLDNNYPECRAGCEHPSWWHRRDTRRHWPHRITARRATPVRHTGVRDRDRRGRPRRPGWHRTPSRCPRQNPRVEFRYIALCERWSG